MGEVLGSHLQMPWVGSLWRQYAFQIFVGGVGFYVASLFPGHPLLFFLLTCFVPIAVFTPYPTKLNFLERHTTNLWERI